VNDDAKVRVHELMRRHHSNAAVMSWLTMTVGQTSSALWLIIPATSSAILIYACSLPFSAMPLYRYNTSDLARLCPCDGPTSPSIAELRISLL